MRWKEITETFIDPQMMAYTARQKKAQQQQEKEIKEDDLTEDEEASEVTGE